MNFMPMRELVEKTRQCDPRELGRDAFVYIDISSVDRLTKRIVAAQRIRSADAPSRARKQVHACDVILSTVRPNLNAVALVPRALDREIASSGFAVFRAKVTALDPSYLFYFLQTDALVSRLTRIANSASYPAVTDDDVLDVPIPVPDVAEQKRISAVLERADRLRRLRRYGLELSENFLSVAYLRLFGDPIENPKKIPIVELGKYIDFLTSGSRGWAQHYVESGTRFIRSLDVQMNHIPNDNAVFVDPPEGTEAERTRVRAGDVLLTVTGSRIGRVAAVPQSLEGAYVSQHVAIIRLKPGLLPKFLSMFLSLETGGQLEIQRFQYGQTKPGLALNQIREFRIQIPTLEQQREFTVLADRYQKFRAEQFESLRQADHLFQTLLQRAFTSGL
jgi:type I restriction enzyme S subunit